MKNEELKLIVKEKYGEIAKQSKIQINPPAVDITVAVILRCI
jgi:hypothetical protein